MTDGRGHPDDRADLGGAVEALFRDSRVNAALAWLVVAVLAVAFVESVLGLDYAWTVFVGVVGVVVLVPPAAFRDPRAMLPWELLALALSPVLVRGLVGGALGTFATYLALAALALLVVVELHTFTALQVTHWFAVVVVVLTTMATVAAWTVFRWNADRFLGTAFLVDNETLMREWLSVILAGVAAGALFDGYFRWRDRRLRESIRQLVGR